ncbi:hypothetical protein CANINC_000491 [Pichia inconspicua]|uniref:Chitobiosyldiphosphodolichol beta-mannosyltransferase n=1 Tax=Pichia inconspicua TaxID=52247 RepID=A0A4T0X626_9ASCO|nr:hypothetical protein CANINC_000491 [[Candida] inconspicua]
MPDFIKYVGFKHLAPTWGFYVSVICWLSVPFFYFAYSNYSFIKNVYKRRSKLEITSQMNEVVIVVLGDLGHSPRMVYHAKSFAELGYNVNICGYLESDLPEFLKSPDYSIHNIPVVKNKRNLPYLIFAFLKVSSQIFDLTSLLVTIIDDNTRFVVMQNPPSLPVLLIIGLIKKVWSPNTQLIIDWHNLNWSILNLKYNNEGHPVVKLMKHYERYCGKMFADLHLTVTKALKSYLVDEFGFDENKIVTLYDRPSSIFSPLESQEELKQIISSNSIVFKDLSYNQMTDRIIVTSTSFTPDEDFELFIEALVALDKILVDSKSKQRIIAIVTGKGPLQRNFMKSLKEHDWKNIAVKNVWLPIEEYPKILKIADLGISLHYSSSGLDLPMKIVDLFGSGVPVITMNYPVIQELVKNDVNGLILKNNKSSFEMANTIHKVLFENKKEFVKIKEGALLESQKHWDEEWGSKLQNPFAIKNSNRL